MKVFLLCMSCFFSLASSYSQSVQKDSLSNLQIQNAVALYDHFTGGEAPVFNGPEYIYYLFVMEGNPYFEKAGFAKGWVGYQSRVYKSMSLFFDVQRNQLVILNADSISPIVINNDYVDSFNLYDHTFISLKENRDQNLFNTAFYDRLYNGKIQLLARRVKVMDPVIKYDQLTRIFYQKDRFYIHKEGLYYEVSNKKEAFHLFADKKSALKKQMRKGHIKFHRKNFEEALVQATTFYDKLTY